MESNEPDEQLSGWLNSSMNEHTDGIAVTTAAIGKRQWLCYCTTIRISAIIQINKCVPMDV